MDETPSGRAGSVAPTSPLPTPNYQPPTTAWAAFLACSWTWVIGMYLPVLLVRDFGVLGWVVFAVPNVVGAAAMGWVISAGGSADFVERHPLMVKAFSVVTIAFHVYVAAWLLPRLVGPAATGTVAAVVATILLARLVARGDGSPAGNFGRGTLGFAAATLALSLGAFAYLLATVPTASITAGFVRPPALGPADATAGLLDLAGLGLVCAFGFGLCPYLDVTFHAARQATGRRGPVAFGLGFGVFFLAMIAFTLAYSGLILGVARYDALAWVLAGHLTVQSVFTVWAHARGLNTFDRNKGLLPLWLSAACVVGIGGATLALQVERAGWTLDGLKAGELGYRAFMAFYGLLFPAYVWTAAVGMQADRPSSRRWAAVVMACVLALPFYWMAFVQRREAWFGVGLLILVVGGLIGRKGDSPREARRHGGEGRKKGVRI